MTFQCVGIVHQTDGPAEAEFAVAVLTWPQALAGQLRGPAESKYKLRPNIHVCGACMTRLTTLTPDAKATQVRQQLALTPPALQALFENDSTLDYTNHKLGFFSLPEQVNP